MLEEFKDVLYRCYKCGYCKFTGPFTFYNNCPSYEKFRFETYSSGGRMWMANGILSGELEWSERLVDIAYACPTCGNCATQCIYPIRDIILKVIEALRAEAVKAGVGPLKSQKAFGEHIGKEHNPYIPEPHSKRLDWLPKDVKLPKEAEIVYFVGCTSSYRQTFLARDTVDVLSKLGVEFTIMRDEWCCTSPLLRTGQWQTEYVSAPEIARHNIEEAEATGARRIVTTCAGCYRTWKKDYLEEYVNLLGSKHDFEVVHTTELLDEMIRRGEVEFTKEVKMRVTYHDPCHLGRHVGLYLPPRNVLKAIPGIELVEMPRTMQNAWCCGAGGGVKSGYPDWSVEIAYERVKEAEKLGVDAIVSACPFCWRNLDDAIKKYGSTLKMYDVIQLVKQAL